MRLFTMPDFIIMILLLVLFIIIPVINIHLFIKHRLNAHLYFIHIISGFIEAFLFCLIMQLSILPASIRQIHSFSSRVFLLFIFFTLLLFFFTKNVKKLHMHIDSKLSPKLTDVFQMIEDAIFITDRNGMIVNRNETANFFVAALLDTEKSSPAKVSPLKIQTLSELSSLIIRKLSATDKDIFSKSLEAVPSAEQIELNIGGTAYLLLLSPIYTGSKKEISSLGINLVFHNIQIEKELSFSLESQNAELNLANETLKENIKIANALEEEKERLRLLNELQDSIIHSIEKVTDSIVQFKKESEPRALLDNQDFIATIAEKLRLIFKEVRINILKLSNKK